MRVVLGMRLWAAVLGLTGAFAFVAPRVGPVRAVAKVRQGSRSSAPVLCMGFFDGLKKMMDGAFDNQEFSAPPAGVSARAKHILVPSAEKAEEIKGMLADGNAFEEMAASFSSCPSASKGGDLGNFRPRTMVAEFDEVVFDENNAVGDVLGPVKTKFGYHLIKIDKRTM